MRRLTATSLFVLGYMTLAALDGAAALVPALVLFCCGGMLLVLPPRDTEPEWARAHRAASR